MLIETHHETRVPFLKLVTVLYDKPEAELTELLKLQRPMPTLTYTDSVCRRIIAYNRKTAKGLGLLNYRNFHSISLGRWGKIYSTLERFEKSREFYRETWFPFFKLEKVDKVFFANLLLKDKLIKELLFYLSTHEPTRWELYEASVTSIFPKIYGKKVERWKEDVEKPTDVIIESRSYHKFRHTVCPRLNLLEEVGIVERKGKKTNFVYSMKKELLPLSNFTNLIYKMCSFCKPGSISLKDLLETYKKLDENERVEGKALVHALFFRLLEREEFASFERIRRIIQKFQFMYPNEILWFKQNDKFFLFINKNFLSKTL